jgi:hypothetical protein
MDLITLEEVGVRYIHCEKSFYNPDYTVWRYRRCNVKNGSIDTCYVAILGNNSSNKFINLLSYWNRTKEWVYGPA